MPASYTKAFFQRKGRKAGKSVDPAKRKAAAKLISEIRFRKWCDEEEFDYDTLPVDDETGKKLLPDVVRNKYLKWRWGWDPAKDAHPRQGYRKPRPKTKKP